MREVKPVKYEEWNCRGEDEAVCPYCGHSNDIVLENNDIEGEKNEMECGECEKTFIYSFSVSVSFDTEPFENYYLRERAKLVKRIKSLESDPQKYDWQKEQALRLRHEIESLDRDIEKILEEETDEEKTEISAATRT